jgi:hypothetical protein
MSDSDEMPTTVTLTKWHWILLACLIGLPSGGVSFTNWQQADKFKEVINTMDKRIVVVEKNQEFMTKVQDGLGDTVKSLAANQSSLIRLEQEVGEIRRQNEEFRRRMDKYDENRK